MNYAKLYDRAYADKDYAGEAGAYAALLGRLTERRLKSLVDVGCGTGRHLEEFCSYFDDLAGVDPDPDMLAVAGTRLKGRATLSDRPLSVSAYDAGVSLFHVVNHVWALDGYFEGAAGLLRPGAPFVFECWNRAAVHAQPPRPVEVGPRRVVLTDWRPVSNEAILTLVFPDGDRVVSHRIFHRVWSILDLTSAAARAGFGGFGFYSLDDLTRPAGPADWKIAVTCTRGSI